jgi:hypothetical protein
VSRDVPPPPRFGCLRNVMSLMLHMHAGDEAGPPQVGAAYLHPRFRILQSGAGLRQLPLGVLQLLLQVQHVRLGLQPIEQHAAAANVASIQGSAVDMRRLGRCTTECAHGRSRLFKVAEPLKGFMM